MKKREKTNEVWQQIPVDTDVVITHGPPKGVRDLTINQEGDLEQCGCTALMKRCWALRTSLKLVLFGHIHNSPDIKTNQGIAHYSLTNTVFSNAACVEDGRFAAGLISFGNILEI